MIITQTRQRRSFLGSLNIGEDLVESLTSICVDNAIFCATFSGVGYIADPVFRVYRHARKDFDRLTYSGTLHVVALHGNVSLKDTDTAIRAHAMGELHRDGGQPQLVSGELIGGRVVAFEFTLVTVDDIRMYRAEDDRSGLDPWLHMEVGPAPVSPGLLVEPVTAPPAPAATAPDPAPESEADPVEVGVGDLIEHPTLGRCEVVEADDDERVTLRLESGRSVELHLDLLHLVKVAQEGARQVIEVRIRRRR
jgi:predicted DNA-binding protein with PD1-like motif